MSVASDPWLVELPNNHGVLTLMPAGKYTS